MGGVGDVEVEIRVGSLVDTMGRGGTSHGKDRGNGFGRGNIRIGREGEVAKGGTGGAA